MQTFQHAPGVGGVPVKDYYWCGSWLGAAKARFATVNAVTAARDIEGHNVYPVSGDDIARLRASQ